MALRDTEDEEVVLVCLDAFRCAIRIACIFGLQVHRERLFGGTNWKLLTVEIL